MLIKIFKRFCCLSKQTFDIKLLEFDKNIFTIRFKQHQSLKITNNTKVQQLQRVQIFDQNSVRFNNKTSFKDIVIQNFFIKYYQKVYYVINPKIIFSFPELPKKGFPIKNVFSKPYILQNIYKNMVLKLKDHTTIDSEKFQLIFKQEIMDISILLKKQKEKYMVLYDLVKLKLQAEKKQRQNQLAKLQKKSKKQINRYFGFLLIQFFFINYGIYYSLSWDVMQPVTCLLGIFDTFIAYWYFLRHKQQFSFQSIYKTKFQRLKKRKLSKFYKNEEKYLELLKIEEILKMKVEFFSTDPTVISKIIRKQNQSLFKKDVNLIWNLQLEAIDHQKKSQNK